MMFHSLTLYCVVRVRLSHASICALHQCAKSVLYIIMQMRRDNAQSLIENTLCSSDSSALALWSWQISWRTEIEPSFEREDQLWSNAIEWGHYFTITSWDCSTSFEEISKLTASSASWMISTKMPKGLRGFVKRCLISRTADSMSSSKWSSAFASSNLALWKILLQEMHHFSADTQSSYIKSLISSSAAKTFSVMR